MTSDGVVGELFRLLLGFSIINLLIKLILCGLQSLFRGLVGFDLSF